MEQLGHLWVLVLAALPLVYWAARSSLQSLRQARALGRVVPVDALPRHVGKAVTVSGRPRTDEEFLWKELSHEAYGSGEGKGWSPLQSELFTPRFCIESESGGARVADPATEVHGAVREVHEPAQPRRRGAERAASGHRRTRTIERTLLPTSRVTACGRVEERDGELRIARDPEVGLILTLQEPDRQARVELLKGLLGGVGAPLLWVVAVVVAVASFS